VGREGLHLPGLDGVDGVDGVEELPQGRTGLGDRRSVGSRRATTSSSCVGRNQIGGNGRPEHTSWVGTFSPFADAPKGVG
jgi:hypothetical protein